MASLLLLHSPFRRTGTGCFNLLDLLLVLLGAGIAYWFIPGATEGPGL